MTDRNTERHRDRQIDREETKGGRREGGWVGSAGAVIVFALPHFLVFSSPIMLRLTLLFKIILKHLVDQQPIMACDNSIKPIDFAKTAISRPSMKFKMRDVRKTLEATNNPREIDFSKLDDLQKRPEGHFDALEILLIIIDGLNIYNLVRVSVV